MDSGSLWLAAAPRRKDPARHVLPSCSSRSIVVIVSRACGGLLADLVERYNSSASHGASIAAQAPLHVGAEHRCNPSALRYYMQALTANISAGEGTDAKCSDCVTSSSSSSSGSPSIAPAAVCAHCRKVEQLHEGPKFARCSRCVQERLADGAFYCSRQCQKDDWKKHKAWHEGMAQLLASAKPSSEHQPEAYGELLKTGLRQIASGDHSAGVATFKSCIQMRPDQAAAHANLGMALRDRGDFVGALPCLLRAVELYEEGTEQWATTSAVAWFAFASSAGSGVAPTDAAGEAAALPLPPWLTTLEPRIAMAEKCTRAADKSMQCWAMLGMALAEQEADLGRAAQAFMKASNLTDQPQTRDGYRNFARRLLQQLQAGAGAVPAGPS